MNNNIVFDLFSDSQATTIAKLGNYLHIHPSEIEKALVYGCSAESFINDLRIDLLAYDSSVVSIVGRHVTTSAENMQSFYRTGLLDLRASLQQDTPLSQFLTKHNIIIDVERKLFIYKGRRIPIEGRKCFEHKCFMGREKPCSWSFGCEAFQQLGYLHNKLYKLGATLEFFVAGTLEEMLDYSTVSHCPEILNTIDQLIAKIKSPYGECTYPLSYDWMSQSTRCYVVEFKSQLSDMETFDPVDYLGYYHSIKGCFNWSRITYDDYYERRIPQRVYDNVYLINRIIDVYVYGSNEQYGSLLPGLSIPADNMKVYRVENDDLIPHTF